MILCTEKYTRLRRNIITTIVKYIPLRQTHVIDVSIPTENSSLRSSMTTSPSIRPRTTSRIPIIANECSGDTVSLSSSAPDHNSTLTHQDSDTGNNSSGQTNFNLLVPPTANITTNNASSDSTNQLSTSTNSLSSFTGSKDHIRVRKREIVRQSVAQHLLLQNQSSFEEAAEETPLNSPSSRISKNQGYFKQESIQPSVPEESGSIMMQTFTSSPRLSDEEGTRLTTPPGKSLMILFF